MSFKQTLEMGIAGESAIAQWMMERGFSVLPVYEKIIDEGKGPQLFTVDGSIVAPDLLIIKQQQIMWIEAKHKTAFSWHRITGRWVTGIDQRHYSEYLKIQEKTELPVWILFLHEGGQAKDSPPNSPDGLFGNDINILKNNENHRHGNWGKSGMVYWARKEDGGSLMKIASLCEFKKTHENETQQSGRQCAECGRSGATYLFYGDGKWYCSKEEIL